MDLRSVTSTARADGAACQAESLTPGVRDDSALFRLSQQIDRVRDTAKWLLSKDLADDSTTARLIATYTKAADEIAGQLDESLRGEMVVLDLKPQQGASIAEVYAVAAQLAAWVDSVHYTPAFELSQKVKAASSEKVLAELATETSPVIPAAPSALPGAGQYL